MTNAISDWTVNHVVLLSHWHFWLPAAFLMFYLLLFTCRRLHAGSLSPRPTGTASLLTTCDSIRRTACSGRSCARTPPTATHSAAPRSWATAAVIRALLISAPACSASNTRFPSREPTSTSHWTWPAKRSPSSWCDGVTNKATSGRPFSLLCVRCGDAWALREQDKRECWRGGFYSRQRWVNWQHIGCTFNYNFRYNNTTK